jgi:hypothetical protein
MRSYPSSHSSSDPKKEGDLYSPTVWCRNSTQALPSTALPDWGQASRHFKLVCGPHTQRMPQASHHLCQHSVERDSHHTTKHSIKVVEALTVPLSLPQCVSLPSKLVAGKSNSHPASETLVSPIVNISIIGRYLIPT